MSCGVDLRCCCGCGCGVGWQLQLQLDPYPGKFHVLQVWPWKSKRKKSIFSTQFLKMKKSLPPKKKKKQRMTQNKRTPSRCSYQYTFSMYHFLCCFQFLPFISSKVTLGKEILNSHLFPRVTPSVFLLTPNSLSSVTLTISIPSPIVLTSLKIFHQFCWPHYPLFSQTAAPFWSLWSGGSPHLPST